MTNDDMLITILPMTILMFTLTTAHAPLSFFSYHSTLTTAHAPLSFFSYHSTELRKEIINQ